MSGPEATLDLARCPNAVIKVSVACTKAYRWSPKKG
jgi:hypothetical protein